MKLGIDIGIKNYALCLLGADNEILEWNVYDLTEPINDSLHYNGKFDIIHVSKNLNKIFKNLFDKYNPELIDVIIENQLPMGSNSIIMKSIQAMTTQIMTLYNIENIKYIGGKTKLKGYDVHQQTYAQRKKSCVAVVKSLIRENELIQLNEFGKKKDDLCDCYLIALL